MQQHRTALLVLLTVAAGTRAGNAEAGSISGRITYSGAVPEPTSVHPSHDTATCGASRPITDETLVVAGDGGVANAVVFLEGVNAADATPGKAKLSQKNCTFVPHVQTATVGTALTIANGDGILHNVHAFLDDQTLFNLAMPVKGLRVQRTLGDAGVVSIRCDSGHTWMRAYIVVVPHAFHATSGTDGRFEIAGVPAGSYKARVWHERLGTREVDVTVEADGAAQLDVAFEEIESSESDEATADVPGLDDRLGELEDSLMESIEETRDAVEKLEQQRLYDARERAMAAGRDLFVQHCASCHGSKGDGKGDATAHIRDVPRDFTKGEFQFRMTPSGQPPTEQDLYRTITVGVLGTAMPSWRKKLTKRQRKLLARYVMTFSDRFWKRRKRELEPIEIPEEPKSDAASIARGKKIYVEMKCAQCHGKGGRGNGPASKTTKDDWGNRILPYDLTRGYFQGGRGAKVIYRAISTGLSGSPMPSYGDTLEPDKRWDLVHYILSLADDRGVTDYLFGDPAGRISPP